MERIASFSVDHNKLERGIYLSRTDCGVDSYDIRLKKPNGGNYLENAAIHTTEHLFATFVRNGEFADKIIYFGPMGCRTGYYFLVKDMSGIEVIKTVQQAFDFIRDYTGEIPGNTAVECGNYLEHDLAGAKRDAAEYAQIIANYEKNGSLAYNS